MSGPLVIVNPNAGSGRAARLAPWLTERLRPFGDAELVITTAPGHATELARSAVADGRERLVAVGGDGTVQDVVEGLVGAGAQLSLGIVPQGSGNDLARSLGLPLGREPAWEVALGARTRRVDIGQAVGGGRTRRFVSAGGIGFDAQVAAAMQKRGRWQRGPIGYLLTTLSELRRFRNRRVRLTLDDGPPEEHTVLLIAVANGPYYGGGMKICPDAQTDDAWLDLCIVGDISRLTAVQQLPNLYRGTHVNHPAVSMRRARRIRIEGDTDARAHLDGEPFGTLPLQIEVVPRALEVAVSG